MKTLSLAARNLLRNGRRTTLTAAAIAFGLALMLFNITLATGQYRSILTKGVAAMAGHVVIEQVDYDAQGEVGQVVTDATARVARVRELMGPGAISPRVQLGGLLNSTTNSVGIGLRGVVPSVEGELLELGDKITAGAWLADDDDRGAVIGVGLAEQLGVEVGDKVVFMGQGVGKEVESRLFRVRGLFRSGSPEQDGFVAFATVPAVQELVGIPDAVHQIAVHLTDPTRSDAVHAVLAKEFSSDELVVKTWQEALPSLVGMIAADKSSNDFLNGVIGLIVAMGVLNTVLMSVLERTREFGVLLAIGMRPRQIAGLVLAEGLLIGLLGTAVGVVFGLLISWPLVEVGLDLSSMMGESVNMEGVTLSTLIMGAWNPARMAQYAAISVGFTVLSAVYPAWHISRSTPVEAMRG